MRVINRTAVSIVGAQPYIEWTQQHDSDANQGMLTVARAKPFGTTVLLPEFELEEDVQEWIEDNWSWLFEFQLDAWTADRAAWPEPRDLRRSARGSASTFTTLLSMLATTILKGKKYNNRQV